MSLSQEDILSCIRNELKSQGITIKKFAMTLNVSEPTMKRWLKGQGLLLGDWMKLLEALGLTPADAISKLQSSRDQFEYSEQQEEAFVKTPGLIAFFQELQNGLSAKDVVSKYKLSSKSSSYYLRKLDDLKLIKWGEGLKSALLKKGEPKWRKNGLLSKTFRSKVFNELIFANKEARALKIGLYRLNLEDIQKLQEMSDELFKFAKTAESKARISNEIAKPIGLAFIADHYEPDFLYSIPNR